MAAYCSRAPPLSCSEGVLRLGPVWAVLVTGRVRMWDKKVECLSMTAGASHPIFFKISRESSFTFGFTRHGKHFEGFFMGICSPFFVSGRCGTTTCDSSVLEHWGELWIGVVKKIVTW